jgi:hypothetical protein
VRYLAVADEIACGLRVEFHVPPALMGVVVGLKGARIRAAQESCAIDRVVVDRDQSVVRIVGSDAAVGGESTTPCAYHSTAHDVA